MHVTLEQVLDYIECPVIYHLKHRCGIKFRPSVEHDFDETIHKAIASFYTNLMSGKIMTAEQMKNKWDALWAKDLTKQQIIGASTNDPKRILHVKGVEMLVHFHQRALKGDGPGIPICINEDFSVEIGRHLLTSKWELIREGRKKGKPIVEVVDFKTLEKKPSWYMAKQDLSLSAQSLGFRKLFQAKEDRIVFHYIKHGKEYYTSRDSNDIRKFMKIIHQVATSMEKNIIYPRQSIKCKKCRYNAHCWKWGLEEKK